MSGRWVDLREAADLLGTSTEAVRKRATRGSLRSERHDGRVVVWVDDHRTEGGREAQGETSADGGALVEVLTEQVSYLKAQLDIRTEELREHRRLLAGLIERLPELDAPVETSAPYQLSEAGAQDAANRAGGPRAPTGRPRGSERLSAFVVEEGVRGMIVGLKTMRLLKAMREQLGETSASRTVDAVDAADAIGMAIATRDFDGRLHDLVRAGYLEPDPNFAAPTVQGRYRITFAGIDAADNH